MEFAIGLGIVLPLAIVLACLACSQVLQKSVPLYLMSRAASQGAGHDANTAASVATPANTDGQEPVRGKNYYRNKARRERARLRKQGLPVPAELAAQAA